MARRSLVCCWPSGVGANFAKKSSTFVRRASSTTKYWLTVEPFTGSTREYTPDAKAAYEAADRIAVTTYSSLFNTNPFFESPEIVIVDDAHAAENYIASHWTVSISQSEDSTLFKAAASVLKSVLSDSHHARLTGRTRGVDDATWVDKVPTSRLVDIADELRVAVDEHIGESKQRYPWRMIASHLPACQLYVAANEILIRPLIPPTWVHAPFANATQRIFMSATLGGGGDLEELKSELVYGGFEAGD